MTTLRRFTIYTGDFERNDAGGQWVLYADVELRDAEIRAALIEYRKAVDGVGDQRGGWLARLEQAKMEIDRLLPDTRVTQMAEAHNAAKVSGLLAIASRDARGLVWCITCGREQKVSAAWRLRNGWPKCCGATMTIDSPEERAEFARQAGGGE